MTPIFIQINGKLTFQGYIAHDVDQAVAEHAARGVPEVVDRIDGRRIHKTVFVRQQHRIIVCFVV